TVSGMLSVVAGFLPSSSLCSLPPAGRLSQRADLTFKPNQNAGLHGWLRLNPTYSVNLVSDILAELDPKQTVIEPFGHRACTRSQNETVEKRLLQSVVGTHRRRF